MPHELTKNKKNCHSELSSSRASLVAQRVKRLPTMRETQVWSLGREDPLEKEMATHSSTLAWKIPRTEKPGRLRSMGSQRVGHDWAEWLHFTLVFYSTTMNHFSIGLWYAIKSGFYTTTSNDQLSGWTEKLQSTSQSQTCIKKGHGHCLVVCCPSDPPQLSESQQNNYTWEVCSVNWWNSPKTAMPAASTGEQIGPKNYSLQPCLNAQCTTDTSEVEQEKKKKLNESGNEVLPYLPY